MRPTITRADPSDAHWAADLTARAFEGLAPMVWLVPPRHRRRAILTDLVRFYVDAALEIGEVFRSESRDAVAVWLPGDGDHIDVTLGIEFADRFRHVGELLAAHRPAAPHHYLAFMAVERNRRGEGLGGALLRAGHARLDAEGLPAYLVSGNPAARDLYARHGYVADRPILLPDGAPFWPMWRPAEAKDPA
ncbi:GNAT family N-acetyltransferase [Catenuloplanes japonicus]|uniref:GNAT family N-acetyltransferase n=1 Tax=Catenuloplanes japonicus TaxID=33876 RepID=UPI0005261AB9|nr:GNAT family N-acetyltransferase [Catenuloplanes japonicus]